MDLREANGLEGVVFTAETSEAVRQWVQDRSVNPEIIASTTRLYLPVGLTGMVAVDANDVIWWDPEGLENAFQVERFD